MKTKDRRKTSKHSRECLPVGTIRIRRREGYKVRFIKVRNSGPLKKRWYPFARVWWERNVGPVPAGKRVIHVDGNCLNDSAGNLELGDASDVAFLWHEANPELSERNYQRCREATAKFNRQNARVKRLTMVFPSLYYPVDHARRLIFNRPKKKKMLVYRCFGVRPAGSTVGQWAAACLGWPTLPFTSSCILTAIIDGAETYSQVLLAVNFLRGRYGWHIFRDPRVLYQYTMPLYALGWIDCRRMGRGEGILFVTDLGRATRRPTCKISAMRGDSLPSGYERRGWLLGDG